MPAVSDVGIGNMALSNIGTKSTIQSFAEESPEAKQINQWYTYSRLQVLEAFNWSFARKRLTLAVHGDAAPDGIWAFRYQYPADCVSFRNMQNPVSRNAPPVPFEIEISDDLTKSIVTDLEFAIGVYTFDLEVTALFSSHFVETLSHRLGAHIALSLTGKRNIKGDMINIYNALILEAPAYNANEEEEEAPPDTDWIGART